MGRDTPVFISYARSDERYATELMTRLAGEPDIAPWQDRISMSPGDFEDQIKAGIDQASYFVLVMTPGALRSRWVEKEWRYAREQGRCVVPIVPAFDTPAAQAELDALRAQLPVWMQQIQAYDFDRYWKRFVAVLQSPCQATRAPFLAANLPANFVERADESKRVIGALLDDGGKNPSGKTVVLYGAGGFGKTTLALGVCHDPDVFTACDGGVLWVTLGQQPAIVTELERLYAALTGERPGFKNQDDAMFEVARKLEGKRCLLVIDDVWSPKDLKPFLHGASSASRLVTSRIFSVAVAAASGEPCRMNVAELKADEAQRMLSSGLPEQSAAIAAHVGQLADRLKRVPLLIELANRTLAQQIARRQTVGAALDWALRKYADLGVVAFDDKNARERSDAVGTTIEVSLGFVADERQRCLELGILQEDTDVPFTVLALLWDMKPLAVEELAQRLDDLGLLKVNLPGRSIRLHDYVREYLETILADRAQVHGRLVDAWRRERQLPAGYAVQQVVFHLVQAMDDVAQAAPRAAQLIAFFGDDRFRRYQQQHGDATALDHLLTVAIDRLAMSAAPETPGLMAALVLLRRSQAASVRDAAVIFQSAADGRLDKAVQLLSLFEPDRDWDALARLLIAWLAPPTMTDAARALIEETAASCDRPHLQTLLAWVRQPPGIVPAGLPPISGSPDLRYVAAILRRAGGSEAIEGLEPLDFQQLASGSDQGGFIAERDGPDLVAFARLDPVSNTQYLERYIEVHASNRYPHYRSRSLAMLIEPILQFPDPEWVRRLVQRIATAALTVVNVDFEEFLPLAVRGMRGHDGDAAAIAELDDARRRVVTNAAALDPDTGRADSWSYYHRRASALAEVLALALGRGAEPPDLLHLARELPKGFAGFRAPAALTLAETTRVVSPADAAGQDVALTSALAAAHRIQDSRFCLQMTAMVNAMRARWTDMSAMDLTAVVGRFLANPGAAEFCSVHRVGEQFEYRAQDQHRFQALPIPDRVRQARTLGAIADIFDEKPQALVAVNDWIWAAPDAILTERLQDGDEVNVPDRDFTPLLAARFAAEALVAPGLTPEQRSGVIQRLVSISLSNPTAVDAVLARLILSTVHRPHPLPPLVRDVPMPQIDPAGPLEPVRGLA